MSDGAPRASVGRDDSRRGHEVVAVSDGAPRALRDHAVFSGRGGVSAAAAVVLPPSPRVVVLGAASDAPPLAAAIALALRSAERASAAIVSVWRGPDPACDAGAAAWQEPEAREAAGTRLATPGARRLAAWLRGRDVVGVARGRLVWVACPGDAGEAVTAARRLGEAVHEPVVTAVAGARPAGLDALVREQDLAVAAAEPGSALAEAALMALATTGSRALACAPLRRGVVRSAALAGLGAPRLDLPLRTTGDAHEPA